MTLSYRYSYKKWVFETHNEKPTQLPPLFELEQVHGHDVVSIDSHKTCADGISFTPNDLLTTTPAIKTADCLPIWLVGERKQYLLHAGWRGLASALISKEIVQDDTIEFALIGPSIQSSHFEVQSDFKIHFPEDKYYQKFDEKLTFNLQLYAKNKILKFWPKSQVIVSPLCTYFDTSLHSYRRDKTSLRNWSIVTSLS